MTERNKPTLRTSLLRVGGALLLGSALLSPAIVLADSAPAAAPAAAAPAAPKPDAVVATVGEDTIIEADLGFAAEDLGQELQSVPPADQRAFLVTVLIDMKVMAKAARDEKLDGSADYKMRLKYLEDRSLRRAYFSEQVTGAITPDAIKAAYDDYVKTFKTSDQVHAEHILVKSEDEAKDIEKQLSGGASFEDLAKAKSIDTGSGAQGGDLGFFAKGQMVKEFEDAAFALEIGKISAPVKSQYGWHIIKVLEKKSSQPQTMDQMGPQLQQTILYKKFNDSVAALKTKIAVAIPDANLAAAVKAQEAEAPPAGQ